MSWKIINRVLALASIDPTFRQALQQDPITTLQTQEIELTQEEWEIFIKYSSLPFSQFCEHLREELPPEEHSW